MGFVYAAGIWGGHAWTEVLVDGQWLPLDAAAYRPGIADATRFQFDSYTLEDNLAGGMAAGLQLYANVDIAVLEYTIRGKTVRVPAPAKPYSIQGDEYRNTWLGFRIRKPAGFDFVSLDAVYPNKRFWGWIEAPRGQRSHCTRPAFVLTRQFGSSSTR
jgi:transglutaminase-like putative cysteine protease